MENHQSECNFLSTVSIFSSPPLAARCPLSPLLPAAAALSFCLLLPPSTLSFPSLSPLLSSPSPLSRLRCPLLPLSLASAVLSFPFLSPPLSSPSPFSRLRCPLLPSLSPPLSSPPPLSPPLSSPSPLSPPLSSPSPFSRLRCPLLPLSLASAVVFGGLQPAARLSLPLSASLCPPPLYFSLHFLPFLPPPLSFLPSFNYFLHFFVAVLPFSSAVCAFPATNVEFSHPPLRDKLVASPIPLHFPPYPPARSICPYLPPSALHPPLNSPSKKKFQKKLPKNLQEQKKPRTFAPRLTKTSGQEGRKVPRKDG